MKNERAFPNEEAAEFKTDIKGWVCKGCRRFYGNDDGAERVARFCCEKDHACGTKDCTGRAKHGWVYCDSCMEKRDLERWLSLPEVEWDGETPLSDGDRYFFDEDSVFDYLEENKIAPEDARFVVCVKERPPRFDMTDFLCDHIPEDMDIDNPEEIEQLVEDWIKAHVPDVWVPGKTRPSAASIRANVGEA